MAPRWHVASGPEHEVRLQARRVLEDLSLCQARYRRCAVFVGGSALQRCHSSIGGVGRSAWLPDCSTPTSACARAALEGLEAAGTSAVSVASAIVRALGDSDRFVRWAAPGRWGS